MRTRKLFQESGHLMITPQLFFSVFSGHLLQVFWLFKWGSSVLFVSQNLNQNPRTLLPKFFGLYCVQSGGKNIRIAVMNNILPRIIRMHLKFDLKGSTYKRRASKKEREKSKPTFKDLDFMQDVQDGLLLDVDTYNALVKTLQRDCLVRETGFTLELHDLVWLKTKLQVCLFVRLHN